MTVDCPRWFRGALDEDELALLDNVNDSGAGPGNRLALDERLLKGLRPVTELLKSIHQDARPVRALAFDKTQASNWGVPWHQDRVIAVKARHDQPGFHSWSRKRGIWHCEPPKAVLQSMSFVRVHLDSCDHETGPMEIATGSHRDGVVPSDRAEAAAVKWPSELCLAERGDVLVLPMLTLHRSRPAQKPSARRVLRIDYASSSLPAPLAWAD